MENMTRTEALARLIEYGLTSEEAEALIVKAEEAQCEPTSRLQPENETTIEFIASAMTKDGRTGVEVFYMPEAEEIEANADDLGGVDWQISHYRTW